MRRIAFAAIAAIVSLLFMSRTGALFPVHAGPMPENTRKLLEKSLSVVELDREIERISGLKTQTQKQIDESETTLAKQEIAIAAQREKAGRVLRSYYMGYKDFWMSALLNANSLPDLINVWDTMDMIVQADKNAMNGYQAEYGKLKKGYDRLRQDKDDLSSVERELVGQRERIAALQREVDAALASSGDADMLRKLMDELNAYWKNVGIYEVKKHFRALADAMGNLPDYVKDKPGILETNGFKAKLTITDAQLNEFLRSQDRRFDDFAFKFDDGLLTMEGDNGNITVLIQGRYEIENEPENAIRFHVDKLVFNGLELPDTTRKDLEREFDLGFYPQKLVKFVKAKSVSMDDGKLVVQLAVGG
ncbi:coiled-coil domain-containing protein [Cohnella suwonensis]|uniref:Coiled-coil domain-containing protein n=1 Tax=Cohnella suwonensis TaxID=696072 RepID=A0ABW0LRF3_9BACL